MTESDEWRVRGEQKEEVSVVISSSSLFSVSLATF